MFKVVSIIILIGFFVGCAGSPVQTGWESEKNRKAMFLLDVGMSKKDVLNTMGEPRKTEAYSNGVKNLVFWLYMTEGATMNDGRLTDSNFTPLAFENGKLTGWGRNYYDQTLKYEHTIEVK